MELQYTFNLATIYEAIVVYVVHLKDRSIFFDHLEPHVTLQIASGGIGLRNLLDLLSEETRINCNVWSHQM